MRWIAVGFVAVVVGFLVFGMLTISGVGMDGEPRAISAGTWLTTGVLVAYVLVMAAGAFAARRRPRR